MTPEVPLQRDMFTGELVDTRTKTQKKKDREQNALKQMQMFKTPEIVQNVRTTSPYTEWLEDTPSPPLVLEVQDVRTQEEIERDLERQAQENTVPLFGDTPASQAMAEDSDLVSP